MGEYLLVHYGEDDSVSVLKSNSKQIREYSGNFVKVKWPRLGVFGGTILEKSGECKKPAFFIWISTLLCKLIDNSKYVLYYVN